MNKKIISKVIGTVFSLVFAGILITLGVVSFFNFGETVSFFENRKLKPLPEFTEEGALDGSYFSGIEDFLKDRAPWRDELLEAKTYTDLNILRRPVVNDIVVTKDALLPYLEYEALDLEKIKSEAEAAADTVVTHAEKVESYGGKYYYVAMPNQYLCYSDSYPAYLNNRREYLKASSEAFFGYLDGAGVDYIDMYGYYLEMGSPEYMTSKIDHHYSLKGALETLAQVAERVERDTDHSIGDVTLGDFDCTELVNNYIGSRSRKLFGLVKSEEKIEIFTPKVEVPFERWNNGNKVSSTVYKLPKDDKSDVLYTTYMGGDIANTVIKTHRGDLPSILIYGESFTNALESVAWYYFDEMHSIDLRHYKKMTLDEYIEAVKPDVVVCVREYSSLALPENGAE